MWQWVIIPRGPSFYQYGASPLSALEEEVPSPLTFTSLQSWVVFIPFHLQLFLLNSSVPMSQQGLEKGKKIFDPYHAGILDFSILYKSQKSIFFQISTIGKNCPYPFGSKFIPIFHYESPILCRLLQVRGEAEVSCEE